MTSGGTPFIADQLRSFVERIERLDEEARALSSDKSEVYQEAKGNGFDVKVLKELIRQRRRDGSELAEFESLLDLYKHALGMAVAETGTSDATRARTKISDRNTGSPAVQNAVAPSGADDRRERNSSQSRSGSLTRSNSVEDGTASAGHAAEKSPALTPSAMQEAPPNVASAAGQPAVTTTAAGFIQNRGDADVTSTESRIAKPDRDLAAGDEGPLPSEPVAVFTDARGFMVADMPAFLERVQ